ncbi:MAG: phosphotriesterase [Rhodospirillaceae bacterium]|jgi:phosphotriesterase-related protein|nr:phosphotriesterase [Rhodospirillaceae bacterium]
MADNKIIQTVRGAIAPSRLGFTSMHEHVLRASDWPYQAIYKDFLGEIPENRFPVLPDKPVAMEDLAYLHHSHHELSDTNGLDEPLMHDEVADFGRFGGGAVLECGAPGIRGDVLGLKRISEATDVHIIASTGLYVEPSWPEVFRTMSRAEFADHMEREVSVGIDGTSIRSGQVKAAINGPWTEPFGAFLEAAAQTAAASGLCMTAHIEECSQEDHRRVVDALARFGMPLDRLILCHFQAHFQELELMRLVEDPSRFGLHLDYACEVLDRGAVICVDCFGIVYDDEPLGGIAESDAYKIAAVCQLLERGYEDQIVMGTDIFMKLMTRRFGGHGYVRLLNYVVPTLKSLGISPSTIEKMCVTTPARLLAH